MEQYKTDAQKVIIIAAIGADGVIGINNTLPWHVPKEYKHYLDCVRGHTVIMGRKTWESAGKDLAETTNIVVSGSDNVNGAINAKNLESAISQAMQIGKTVFIAGGTSIYTQALEHNYVDQMYLSIIYGDYKGDRYFPNWKQDDWVVINQEKNAQFEFIIWQNKKPVNNPKIKDKKLYNSHKELAKL